MVIKVRKLTREERNARIVTEIRNNAGADKPRDRLMQIKKMTALVAIEMARIHGGDWQIGIDHDLQMILISRRPDPTAS